MDKKSPSEKPAGIIQFKLSNYFESLACRSLTAAAEFQIVRSPRTFFLSEKTLKLAGQETLLRKSSFQVVEDSCEFLCIRQF